MSRAFLKVQHISKQEQMLYTRLPVLMKHAHIKYAWHIPTRECNCFEVDCTIDSENYKNPPGPKQLKTS
jgi:hypothetical protein